MKLLGLRIKEAGAGTPSQSYSMPPAVFPQCSTLDFVEKKKKKDGMRVKTRQTHCMDHKHVLSLHV
jgi:hypothetical protein